MFRRLNVCLDGDKRAGLRPGDSAEIEVDEEEHVLQIQMDWFTSPEVTVACSGDSVRAFTCRMPGPFSALIRIFSGPDSAFGLVPDDARGA